MLKQNVYFKAYLYQSVKKRNTVFSIYAGLKLYEEEIFQKKMYTVYHISALLILKMLI